MSAGAQPTPVREEYLLNGAVTVTDKRIVINEQTYASGALESFRTGRKESTTALVLTIVSGIFALVALFADRGQFQSIAYGLFFIAAICGVVYWFSRKAGIVLRFVSGYEVTIEGTVEAIEDVADALTKILIWRAQ